MEKSIKKKQCKHRYISLCDNLKDKGGAEFYFKKPSGTVPLDNPAASRRCLVWMEAWPGGAHNQLESCFQSFAVKMVSQEDSQGNTSRARPV